MKDNLLVVIGTFVPNEAQASNTIWLYSCLVILGLSKICWFLQFLRTLFLSSFFLVYTSHLHSADFNPWSFSNVNGSLFPHCMSNPGPFKFCSPRVFFSISLISSWFLSFYFLFLFLFLLLYGFQYLFSSVEFCSPNIWLGALFTMSSRTFILFCLRKTSVSVYFYHSSGDLFILSISHFIYIFALNIYQIQNNVLLLYSLQENFKTVIKGYRKNVLIRF